MNYSGFVQLQEEVLTVLTLYLSTRLGTCSGVSFVDSTCLPVCHSQRISKHRVFRGHAERTKTSMGWFYGFKLHLVINDTGDLLDVALTSVNRDDRTPVKEFAEGLQGSLFADRGYISKDLRDLLKTEGVNLVYKVHKNMQPLSLLVCDEMFLNKRFIIESVIKELKTQTQVEHTRKPRNFINFHVNAIAAVIAYTYLLKKPTLKLDEKYFERGGKPSGNKIHPVVDALNSLKRERRANNRVYGRCLNKGAIYVKYQIQQR